MANKQYIIKTYSGGVYTGTLPYVVDDVEYTETINTAGCEITVKLGSDLKNAGIDVDVDNLITNSGAYLVDDSGNRLISRKDYVFTNVRVDLGNQIDIWLYYSGAPNGTRIFTGMITSWEADEGDASITMTALSYGVQLDNYIIEVLPNSKVLNYPSYDTSDTLFALQEVKGTITAYNRTVAVAESFQPISSTSISSISVAVARPATLAFDVASTLSLYSSTPSSAVYLESASRMITNTTLDMVTYTFATPIALTGGSTYHWQLTISGDVDVNVVVGRDSGGGYSVGNPYTLNDSTMAWTAASGDYAFQVVTSSGALGNQFNSYDPGAIIVALLDSFTSAGGVVDCSTTSVWATGTVVSYTFKYNTVLDGIKKCVELAPANWYWYVDVGTNIVYFKNYSRQPDHTFLRGQHIGDMKVRYSLEHVKNKVIYSGGDPGTGTNIISTKANTGSISRYGQWLEMDSDSRVKLQTTADTLALNKLGEAATPQFSVTATILASQYDIETIKIGQMATFRNCNDLTNDLILLISSVQRRPDAANVTFSTLPPTQAHRIEDIRRNLDVLATANNPSQ